MRCAPIRAACLVLLALSVTAALTPAAAQDIGISFEVFSSPKAPCIANAGKLVANFSFAFPQGTRVPQLYTAYAGSMPNGPATEACRRLATGAAAGSPPSVVLTPTSEGEVQGNLKIFSTAGSCTKQTPASPLQFAVQLAGSTGTEDLGLVSCPNQGQACHLFFVGTSPNPGPGTGSPSGGGGAASGCIYCGSVCRIVVKKGIFLSTQSDDTKGPCCDGCNCKFSHYVQTGRFANRVRTYYYICSDPTCFPRSATVVVAGRGRQPLSSLRLGDAVLAVNPKTGHAMYSQVYAMPHRSLASRTAYLQLTDAHNRTLTLSASHLLYTCASPSGRLVDYTARPASALRPGQYVWSEEAPPLTSSPAAAHEPAFGPARVERIDRVYGPGMVSPFTLEGTLVVDGVLASSYATHSALPAEVAHAALGPLRWAWRVWPGALRVLHRGDQGDSPALAAAGLSVLGAAERVRALVASA